MQPESEAMLGSWSCKDACVAGSELCSIRIVIKMLVQLESEATLGFQSCKYACAARI